MNFGFVHPVVVEPERIVRFWSALPHELRHSPSPRCTP
jgi:hypothetical protein